LRALTFSGCKFISETRRIGVNGLIFNRIGFRKFLKKRRKTLFDIWIFSFSSTEIRGQKIDFQAFSRKNGLLSQFQHKKD